MDKLLLQYEQVPSTERKSYRIMKNVKLKDFYFWHVHPEIEIAYINAKEGLRQVGDHVASYSGGELIMVGSDIPHLNFDYRSPEPYDIVVIHLNPFFIEKSVAHAPEYERIQSLFDLASQGISFSNKYKNEVGHRLLQLDTYDGIDQFLELLKILDLMADDQSLLLLHDHPFKKGHRPKEQERLQDLLKFIEEHYEEKISISQAAARCYLTNEAFCRFFKKMTKLTFTDFLNHYRINQSKKLLSLGYSVTEASYRTGFDSIAYYSKMFKKITGITPRAFVQSLG